MKFNNDTPSMAEFPSEMFFRCMTKINKLQRLYSAKKLSFVYAKGFSKVLIDCEAFLFGFACTPQEQAEVVVKMSAILGGRGFHNVLYTFLVDLYGVPYFMCMVL